MPQEITIEPRTGQAIDIATGQRVVVTDVEGGQVADFYAHVLGDLDEFLSPGATIDCNESLSLRVGDTIYSNRYRPLLRVVSDDVGEHDLLHPCCRSGMYDFFYDNGEGHPSCLDNINQHLPHPRPSITPLNLFMYTEIATNGAIAVKPPLSRPGDSIEMEALTDLRLIVAACSVSESNCNSGRCTAIRIAVSDA